MVHNLKDNLKHNKLKKSKVKAYKSKTQMQQMVYISQI
jgi:hypothetical protein